MAKKEEIKQEENEFTYPCEELIQSAPNSLGVASYIAAGALIGIKSITLTQAQKKINEFLKRGVE